MLRDALAAEHSYFPASHFQVATLPQKLVVSHPTEARINVLFAVNVTALDSLLQSVREEERERDSRTRYTPPTPLIVPLTNLWYGPGHGLARLLCFHTERRRDCIGNGPGASSRSTCLVDQQFPQPAASSCSSAHTDGSAQCFGQARILGGVAAFPGVILNGAPGRTYPLAVYVVNPDTSSLLSLTSVGRPACRSALTRPNSTALCDCPELSTLRYSCTVHCTD